MRLASAALVAASVVAGLALLVRFRGLLAARLKRHSDRPLYRTTGVVRALAGGVLRGSVAWRAAALGLVGTAVLVLDIVRTGSAPIHAACAVVVVAVFIRTARAWATRRRPGTPFLETVGMSVVGLLLGGAAITGLESAEVASAAALAAALLAGRAFDPMGKVLVVWLRDLHTEADAAAFTPSRELRQRTEELRERFLRERRVVVSQLLAEPVARELAAFARSGRFELVARGPREAPAPPECRLLERIFAPHERCTAECSSLCGFARSLTNGPLRDWLCELTRHPALVNRSGAALEPVIAMHAFRTDDFLSPHADGETGEYDRAAIVCVWHASEEWCADWGGLLKFHDSGSDGARTVLVPRFNELHLFAVDRDVRHEVTRVSGPDTRFTVNLRLNEPLEGAL
jgi:hypothetical protein